MAKNCSLCTKRKPRKAFQTRRASPDGLTSACKECLSARDKERNKLPHRVAARIAYAKTERGRERHTAATKTWGARNSTKRKAHIAVGNALRDGKISKPSKCQRCKKKRKLHGHHHDYKKPLDVEWLCTPCHTKEHRNERDEKQAA